jgi:hypothetical protein
MKVQVATVALEITRDAMTILPAVCPAHELPIKKAIFGSDNVQVLDAKTEPVELDSEGEVERLVGRYGAEALEKSYGTNYAFAVPKACEDAAVKAGRGKAAE